MDLQSLLASAQEAPLNETIGVVLVVFLIVGGYIALDLLRGGGR